MSFSEQGITRVPCHAKRCILGHLHAQVQREVDILILKKRLHVATKQFGNDAHTSRDGARAHEQNDIRMVNLAEDLHLLPEGGKRLGVEILLMKHLDGHVLGASSSLVHGSERTVAEDANLFDLMRPNFRRSRVRALGLRSKMSKTPTR